MNTAENQQDSGFDLVVGAKDIARFVGLPIGVVRAMHGRGELPITRMGGYLVADRGKLRAALDARLSGRAGGA
jgi:hypothetical protein